MRNKRLFLSSLVVVPLIASLCINIVLWSQHSLNEPPTRNFVFQWNSESQNITVGETLILNITFTIENETLTVTAKINDDEYKQGDSLGLAFDKNHNGTIDFWSRDEPVYVLYADNTTYIDEAFLTTYGSFAKPLRTHDSSPYHSCTFSEEEGYTFTFSISMEELNVTNDLVHICYHDRSYRINHVWVPPRYLNVWVPPFHFGVEGDGC